MSNSSKRILLHATGAALLLCLIPLSVSYGRMAAIIICLLSLACFATAGFTKPDAKRPSEASKPREPYESPYEVEFDEREIRVLYKGALREKLLWSELQAVGITIDDSFLPAPWWMLFASPSSGCRYPNEARGGKEMLGELQSRLPGFDNRAVIEAMALMEGGRLVWSKEFAQAK